MSSIHDRVTRAALLDKAEPVTERVTGEGWLSFEAYVDWVAASAGVSSLAFTPAPTDNLEREVEDQRSTIRPLTRSQTREISRSHRRSVAASRRVLKKAG